MFQAPAILCFPPSQLSYQCQPLNQVSMTPHYPAAPLKHQDPVRAKSRCSREIINQAKSTQQGRPAHLPHPPRCLSTEGQPSSTPVSHNRIPEACIAVPTQMQSRTPRLVVRPAALIISIHMDPYASTGRTSEWMSIDERRPTTQMACARLFGGVAEPPRVAAG